MAVTAVTPVDLGKVNAFTLDAVTFTQATTAAHGFLVDVSGHADQKIVMLFQNTNQAAVARTATIKAGDALQGVADLASGDVAAAKIAAVTVESGKFVNLTGTDKGKILVIPSHAELKMACLVLP